MFGTTIDTLSFHHFLMMNDQWVENADLVGDDLEKMKEKGFVLRDVKTQSAGEYHILVILCWAKQPEPVKTRHYLDPYNVDMLPEDEWLRKDKRIPDINT
jgi:hypothetical protein